jgi:hypothetical protein
MWEVDAMGTNEPAVRANGGCLCGAVRYRVRGPLRDVVSCHCTQCRRTSGHFVAATAARSADVILLEDRGLRWYTASNDTRRGFCDHCGSSLFWEPAEGGHISIMAGSLDDETGLKTVAHICVETAGDYYRIGDGVTQIEGDNHGVVIPQASTSDQS